MSLTLVKRDGVHRKVAAREIPEKGSAELYGIRSPLVRIARFEPVGGYLNDSETRILGARLHPDRAIVIFVERIGKYGLYLLGLRVGVDVPILRLQADNKIADTAADQVRLITGLTQVVPDSFDFRWDAILHCRIVAHGLWFFMNRAVLCRYASVVKWISRLTSDQLFRVRILAEALETRESGMVSCRAGGYSLMVEHLVANQIVGVRFSIPALLSPTHSEV